jgi:hypothetical protein
MTRGRGLRTPAWAPLAIRALIIQVRECATFPAGAVLSVIPPPQYTSLFGLRRDLPSVGDHPPLTLLAFLFLETANKALQNNYNKRVPVRVVRKVEGKADLRKGEGGEGFSELCCCSVDT